MDHNDLLELKLQLESLLVSTQDFSANACAWRAAPIILPDADDRDTDDIPGLRLFATAVRREIETLDKFLASAEDSPNALSSNAPYYLAVWNEVVRAPPPILAIGKNFVLPKENGRAKPSVKVDVVADDGRLWIRVNTTKNSRLMAELRESDSYLEDDSDAASDDGELSSAFAAVDAPSDLDNSLLRMGHALSHAALHNNLSVSSDAPRITMRLTRLEIGPNEEVDPRIPQTVRRLEDMGINVELGEHVSPLADVDNTAVGSADLGALVPTRCVNLDLSLLIALISDLTHAPLPESAAEASSRFKPVARKWKARSKSNTATGSEDESDAGEHSRALVGQLQQEMSSGLLDDIRHRMGLPAPHIGPAGDNPPESPVEFWTTKEAMDRCLSIADKIGGEGERRRAASLFANPGVSDPEQFPSFWQGSRYPPNHLPGIPVQICPDHDQPDNTISSVPPSDPFQSRLIRTCQSILVSSDVPDSSAPSDPAKPIASRLTPHTVRSLVKGALWGITTLTANRASVKAILREMRQLDSGGAAGTHGSGVSTHPEGRKMAGEGGERTAWIWVVEPRSLAEKMRTDA